MDVDDWYCKMEEAEAEAETIRFYKLNEPFGEFSNFYTNKHQSIVIDNVTWNSAEHYFQCQKFKHVDWYYTMMYESDSPMKCKLLGSQKTNRFSSNWYITKKKEKGKNGNLTINDAVSLSLETGVGLRPDWEEIKLDVMRCVLYHKFAQNKYLLDLLLSTGDKYIEENSPKDYFWGCGLNKTGKNHLGKCLMQLRKQLST